MSKQTSEKNLAIKARSGKHRLWALWLCLLTATLLVVSITYLWMRPQQANNIHVQSTVQPTQFQPVIGDVNDPEHDDPDITVQQALVPGFQFRSGGYTLSGIVIDAQTRRPVFGAIVWIDLPVIVGQPTTTA